MPFDFVVSRRRAFFGQKRETGDKSPTSPAMTFPDITPEDVWAFRKVRALVQMHRWAAPKPGAVFRQALHGMGQTFTLLAKVEPLDAGGAW